MPIYVLNCPKCNATKEMALKMTDENPLCDCGTRLEKVIQPTNVVFKCPGFPGHDSKVRMVDGVIKSDGSYQKIDYHNFPKD